MLVDHGAFFHARVYVGDADEDANAAIRKLLRPLDLIEIFRGVVIDGGPEQVAQIGETVNGRRSGLRLDCGQLGLGSGGKIGLKAVLDHGGMGGGDKIEVEGVGGIGMHEDFCS